MESDRGESVDLDDSVVETSEEALEELVEQEEASAEKLSELLSEARAKADEHWDQLMRSRAELDNLKKRHERELENAHKYSQEKLVNELLMVWDSLQLGNIAALDENADIEKLREGTSLTLKLMTDAMEKFNVFIVDPEGEKFDPELHQAISMIPRDDIDPDIVVNVVQKGYTLNGRLLRPAMVTVSQAPPS